MNAVKPPDGTSLLDQFEDLASRLVHAHIGELKDLSNVACRGVMQCNFGFALVQALQCAKDTQFTPGTAGFTLAMEKASHGL